jgi:hypothetical protein
VNDRHVSDDPELTAGYVLGKVSPEEKERIEAHLQGCAACRAAVEAELRVAAAARRLGRDQIKGRLRRRLAPAHRSTRILAVAASIVTLIGIGVIARQILVRNEQPQLESALKEQKQERSMSTDLASPSNERERLRAGSEQDHAEVTKRKANLQNAAQAPAGRRDESLTVSGAPPPSPAVAMEKAREATAPAARDAEVAGKVSAEESYWTEGIPSSTSLREGRALSVTMDKKDASAKGAGAAAPTQQFVLTQRRAAELPASQQNRQIFRNSIPTHVQQRGAQTVMTLYLDSLVDQNELSRARVEQPGADSLVIRLRDQNIQYQLPSTRNRQQVR